MVRFGLFIITVEVAVSVLFSYNFIQDGHIVWKPQQSFEHGVNG